MLHQKTTPGMLAAARAVGHALVLAGVVLIVGLIVGLTGLTPPVATAQIETTDGPDPSLDPFIDIASETFPAPATELPADVQLRLGETAALDGGALQLTFSQVAEDSRCPRDVLCIWMGRAVVRLEVVVDGVERHSATVTLYPGPRTQRSPDLDATVGRYVLSLADLQPYPTAGRAGRTDPPAERVATIHVAITR
jgi:hypothetical protein